MSMGTSPDPKSEDYFGILTITNISLELQKHDIYIAAYNKDGVSTDTSVPVATLQILEEANSPPMFT